MHACFSGNNKIIKEITKNMKAMSLNMKVGSAQRRRREVLAEEGSAKNKIVPAQQEAAEEAAAEQEEGEEKEEEEEEERGEWIAEPEPGVLMTLVSRPNGTNHLKKIRFREQLFDAWAAQTWWSHNYLTILELYTISHSQSTPVTPCHSEDEVGTESSNCSGGPSSGCGSGDTLGSPILGLVTAAASAPLRHTYDSGVFIAPSRRDQLSRERFGEVKARVWWEENKATLQHSYSS